MIARRFEERSLSRMLSVCSVMRDSLIDESVAGMVPGKLPGTCSAFGKTMVSRGSFFVVTLAVLTGD